MKIIKLAPNNFYLKILLYFMVLILIFISNSKIIFSNGLDKNLSNINFPEKQLAIKYCDAINKKIFKGLNNEASLKYEYYFSSLRKSSVNDYKVFFKNFKSNVMKNCSYKLTELDKTEFETFIKKYLSSKSFDRD